MSMKKTMQGDILTGSLALKVSEPAWMSPRLLIGREGYILAGLLTFNVQSKCRLLPSSMSSYFYTDLLICLLACLLAFTYFHILAFRRAVTSSIF